MHMMLINRQENFKEKLNRSYVMIILMIIILAILVSFASFFRLYYSENKNNIRQITELAVRNIKYEYNNIEQYVLSISTNRVLRDVMLNIDFGDNQGVKQSFQKLRDVLGDANYIGTGNKVKIIFASQENKYNYDEFQDENYFCAVNGIEKEKLDEPYLGYITEKHVKYLLYIQPVFTEFGSERIGNVAVFYDLERNFRKFSDINESTGGVFFVLNEEGEILCHHKKEYILSKIQEESFGEQLFCDKDTFILHDGSKNYFCAVEVMPITNWRAVSVIPMNTFYNNMLFYLASLIAACIAVVFIAFNMSKRFVGKIIYPVNKICNAMKKTDMIDESDDKLFAEFKFMAVQYNSMISRIKYQMNEISSKETEKRKADMRVLYEQINPHFLYNTLDSINWLVAQSNDKNSEKVLEMVSRLAKMFRIGLSKGKEMITVADEIEHVKSYIGIQQIRYSDSFTTEYDIDKDVLACRIIKIVLQPIVENAILHGFDDLESGGLIKISACSEDSMLIFTVEDNGRGADAECIKRIMEQTPANEKSGYGLYNIQKRIKLYYGDEYGIEVTRSGSGGMKFKIRMPKVKEGDI